MLGFAPFSVGIIGTVIACFIGGSHTVRLCGAVLLMNWVVLSAAIWATKIYDPWYFSFALDFLCGAILLAHPAGRAQAMLGASFITQMIMHLAYGSLLLTGRSANYEIYYNMLTIVAWVQLAIVWGYAGGDIGGRIYRSRFVRHISASLSRSRNLGKPR